MSKRLRCIGGSHDGKYVTIKDDMTSLRMVNPRTMRLSEDSPSQITYTEYTLRKISSTDHWSHEFLTPHDWSDRKAIEHQFSK